MQSGVAGLPGSFAKGKTTAFIVIFYNWQDSMLFYNGLCLAILRLRLCYIYSAYVLIVF